MERQGKAQHRWALFFASQHAQYALFMGFFRQKFLKNPMNTAFFIFNHGYAPRIDLASTLARGSLSCQKPAIYLHR
jgi:hypothetical protein